MDNPRLFLQKRGFFVVKVSALSRLWVVCRFPHDSVLLKSISVMLFGPTCPAYGGPHKTVNNFSCLSRKASLKNCLFCMARNGTWRRGFWILFAGTKSIKKKLDFVFFVATMALC